MGRFLIFFGFAVGILFSGGLVGGFSFSAVVCKTIGDYFHEFGSEDDQFYARYSNSRWATDAFYINIVEAAAFGCVFALLLLATLAEALDAYLAEKLVLLALCAGGLSACMSIIMQLVLVTKMWDWTRILHSKGQAELARQAKALAGFSLVFPCIAAVIFLGVVVMLVLYILQNRPTTPRTRPRRDVEAAGQPLDDLATPRA